MLAGCTIPAASPWLGMETGSSPGWIHQDGAHLHWDGSIWIPPEGSIHLDGSIRFHFTSPMRKLPSHVSILLLPSTAAAAPVCSKGHLNSFISSNDPSCGGFWLWEWTGCSRAQHLPRTQHGAGRSPGAAGGKRRPSPWPRTCSAGQGCLT